MKDPNTQEPRGFAFIIFKDLEAYSKAINTSHNLKGRRIECRPALSKQKAKLKTNDEKGKKLFIGGLSLDTTENELIDYFKTYGEIYKAYLIYDKKTNTSRGFGFVEFRQFPSADSVIKAGEHQIKGKVIECKTILQKNELEMLPSKKCVKIKSQGQKKCNADELVKTEEVQSDAQKVESEEKLQKVESEEKPQKLESEEKPQKAESEEKPQKADFCTQTKEDFCTQTSYDDYNLKPEFQNVNEQNIYPDSSMSNSKEVQCDFSPSDMNSYYIDLESKLGSSCYNIEQEMANYQDYLSTTHSNNKSNLYRPAPNKSCCNQNLINKNYMGNSLRGDTRSHQENYMGNSLRGDTRSHQENYMGNSLRGDTRSQQEIQFMNMKNVYPYPNRPEMVNNLPRGGESFTPNPYMMKNGLAGKHINPQNNPVHQEHMNAQKFMYSPFSMNPSMMHDRYNKN